jgi:hypothetical protein
VLTNVSARDLIHSLHRRCESRIANTPRSFYPKPFSRFNDPGYGLAFRDIDRVETASKVMTVWPDPRTEQQSQAVRELTTLLLVETDPKKLNALVEQMTRIVEDQIRRGVQN